MEEKVFVEFRMSKLEIYCICASLNDNKKLLGNRSVDLKEKVFISQKLWNQVVFKIVVKF